MGAELHIYLNHSLSRNDLWKVSNEIINDGTIEDTCLKIRKHDQKSYGSKRNYEYSWGFKGSETYEQFIESLTLTKFGVFFPTVSNSEVDFKFGQKGIILSTYEPYDRFVADLKLIELYRPLTAHIATLLESETSIYYPNSYWMAQCIDELVWLGKGRREIEDWLNENNVRRSPTVSGILRFTTEEIITEGKVLQNKFSELDAYYQEEINTRY